MDSGSRTESSEWSLVGLDGDQSKPTCYKVVLTTCSVMRTVH